MTRDAQKQTVCEWDEHHQERRKYLNRRSRTKFNIICHCTISE